MSEIKARLGDVAAIIRGVTFAPEDRVATGSDGSTVCFRTANIQAELDTSDLIAIPSHGLQRSDQRVQVGDILISSANSWNLVGRCVSVPRLDFDACAGGFISILRGDSAQVDLKYLYHWLNSPRVQAAVRGCANKTTSIANLSFPRFLDLELPLPPVVEQRRIAELLDRADAVRRKREESRRLVDELLRSVFLEMFGDPVRNENGWGVFELGNIAQIQGGLQLTPSRARLPLKVSYLRVANVHRGTLDLTEIKRFGVTSAEIERSHLRKDDVLIVEGHGNPREVGRCAVWDGSIEVCLHQNHLIRVRPDPRYLEAHYLNAFINSAGGRRQLLQAGKTTSGLNTISTRQVKDLEIPLPPIEFQAGYARSVAAIQALSVRQEAAGGGERALAGLLQVSLLVPEG